MCGIAGVLWLKENTDPSLTKEYILKAIEENSVRGTDATGIAALKIKDEPQIFYYKLPVHPKLFVAELKDYANEYGWQHSQIIIIHDRAYTSCPPYNNYCNHPLHIKFTDGTALFLVHNGVIYEYFIHDYNVDVDTFRMLVKYKEEYEKTGNPVDAIAKALKLTGSKAILAFHVTKEKTYFYYYRHKNPLHTASYGDMMLFSSIEKPIKAVLKDKTPRLKITSVAEDTLHIQVFQNRPWKRIVRSVVSVRPSVSQYGHYYRGLHSYY